MNTLALDMLFFAGVVAGLLAPKRSCPLLWPHRIIGVAIGIVGAFIALSIGSKFFPQHLWVSWLCMVPLLAFIFLTRHGCQVSRI